MFQNNDSIIECVPNFSEGRNIEIIKAIENAITNVASVKLLNVDIGADANRTVYTFAGKPSAVLEAAFQAIKTAQQLIDMRQHSGAHPRMGACDVCPLIPLQNISMDAVVDLSKQLGKRIGALGIPVFLYEQSASTIERKKLDFLRKGEYEAIEEKMKTVAWQPDFGPHQFNSNFGMMALGARNFLVAYNINLTTKDEKIAKEIAKEIRMIRNKNDGSYVSNLFKYVKAIGWYMAEFNCAQVSTNITDIEQCSIVDLYDAVNKIAKKYNVTVNGSELIGMLPRKVLQHKKMSEDAVIEYLGLNSVKPFSKEKNIIEYQLFS